MFECSKLQSPAKLFNPHGMGEVIWSHSSVWENFHTWNFLPCIFLGDLTFHRVFWNMSCCALFHSITKCNNKKSNNGYCKHTVCGSRLSISENLWRLLHALCLPSPHLPDTAHAHGGFFKLVRKILEINQTIGFAQSSGSTFSDESLHTTQKVKIMKKW